MDFDPASTAETVVHDVEDLAPGRLRARVAMLSHPGLARSSNEDSVVYSAPDESSPDATLGVLALVADGMGGHASGEIASQMAAESLHYLFYRRPQPVPAALAEGFAAANLAIHERGLNDPNCAGMGTTCTVIVLRNDHIWLGHVGDSRAYLVRNGKIHLISEDHSLVAELVRQGKLTEEEAKNFPDRNVILRALGIHPQVEPMIWREGLPAQSGDILVLCSDGLNDVVDDETIRQTAGSLAPFEACEALIQHALRGGAPDNVSVGVIAIGGAETEPKQVGRTTLQIEPAGQPETPT
jgi:serine/threonine protein phosphatase PrpC